jgi:hypothetical protein
MDRRAAALGDPAPGPHATFVIVADYAGRVRWKLLSATGETTASSAETFAGLTEGLRGTCSGDVLCTTGA